MASSTTKPIAMTKASKVSVLIENPATSMIAQLPIRHTGIVTNGMMLARTERKKKRISTATSTIDSPIVRQTDSIDRSMNTVVSLAISTETPAGNSAFSLGKTSRTACASVNGFAVACLITPSETAFLPLKRTIVRSLAGATSTRATSLMRTV